MARAAAGPADARRRRALRRRVRRLRRQPLYLADPADAHRAGARAGPVAPSGSAVDSSTRCRAGRVHAASGRRRSADRAAGIRDVRGGAARGPVRSASRSGGLQRALSEAARSSAGVAPSEAPPTVVQRSDAPASSAPAAATLPESAAGPAGSAPGRGTVDLLPGRVRGGERARGRALRRRCECLDRSRRSARPDPGFDAAAEHTLRLAGRAPAVGRNHRTGVAAAPGRAGPAGGPLVRHRPGPSHGPARTADRGRQAGSRRGARSCSGRWRRLRRPLLRFLPFLP